MYRNYFGHLFKSLTDLRVGIIGDVMLDTYLWGNVDRISPEAPVPVLSLSHKEYRMGGAANVALNLKAFTDNVDVFSVTGDDEDGTILFNCFVKNGISTKSLIKSKKRITTNKSRIISRSQQLLRMDSEIVTDLIEEEESMLLERIESYVIFQKPKVIIMEDYNKGVLTPIIITSIISLCKKYGIYTVVDPKKKNFFLYQGVSIFKPNLKEAKEALQINNSLCTSTVLDSIHYVLSEKLHHHITLTTLSENGIYFRENELGGIIPSHIRKISDVSGAGDTVIAVASLIYAATGDIKLSAEVSNIAGGLVCEELGTVAIDKQQLINECTSLLYNQNYSKA